MENINFLYPVFLWGLTLILIPILIHLFNFRRYKKIYFSNISFLQSVKEQTKFASRLKHLLVLLSRILMIAFLVLAFSQPYISEKKQTLRNKKSVAIYIDNSFSMRAQPQKGTQLDVALVAAKKTADAFPDDMSFSLITNDETQQNLSKSELNDAIQKVDFSPAFIPLSEIIKNFLSIKSNDDLFIISDFQKNFALLQDLHKDSTHHIYFIPLENQKVNNLSIDSCWIETPVNTPGEAVDLHFSVSNFSQNTTTEIPVKLFINDSLKTITKVSFGKKTKAQGIFHYLNPNTKEVLGKIQITDYPISFDNELLFAYPLKNRFHILAYSPNNGGFIDKFFENDTHFIYNSRNLTNPDYTDIDDFDFLIINGFKTLPDGLAQVIKQFLSKGKNVLFIPAFDGDITNYNQLFSELHIVKFAQQNENPMRIGKIESKADIFKKVFKILDKNTKMPLINQFFTTKRNPLNNSSIYLKTENNMPVFSETKFEKGQIFVLNAPDTKSNEDFFTSPVFVPLLYNLSTASTNAEKLYYKTGQNNQISVVRKDNTEKTNPDEMVHISSIDNRNDFIPYQQNSGNLIQLITGNNDIQNQGFFQIMIGETPLKTVAFNFARQESDMSFLTKEVINKFLTKNHLTSYKLLDNSIQTLTQTITTQDKGIELWRWMLLFAILFLVAEILLLRFWQ